MRIELRGGPADGTVMDWHGGPTLRIPLMPPFLVHDKRPPEATVVVDYARYERSPHDPGCYLWAETDVTPRLATVWADGQRPGDAPGTAGADCRS